MIDDGLTTDARANRNYRESDERHPSPVDLEFLERRHRTLLFRPLYSEDGEYWRAAIRRAGRARGWKGLLTGRADEDRLLCWATIDPALPHAPNPAL